MRIIEPEWVLLGADPEAGRPGAELATRVRVEVDNGFIVGLNPAEGYPSDAVEVRKLPGCLLLPGLVNAHSHSFQRAFRGHTQWRDGEQDDFWTWRDAMYRVANALSPDGIEAISALTFLELARAGVTKVGEFHYLHHAPDGARYADPDELAHRVIRGALSVGVRIALLRVAYGRHSFGRELQPDQRRFGDRSPDESLAAVQRLARHPDSRVSVGLAPHSVRAVPPGWWRTLAGYPGVIHAHVSEQSVENDACIKEYGLSPTAALAEYGVLSDRFTAVHLTRPLPGDLDRMREAMATLCVCPSTELDLGDGFLPLEAREGIPLALGTDSHAVTDMLGEARALEMHARGLASRRNVLAPPGQFDGLALRLLAAATSAGHRALGSDARGITVGAPADFCAINLHRPDALGVPPLAYAAFVAPPDAVTDTWVAGSPVIVSGRHAREEDILASAREIFRVLF